MSARPDATLASKACMARTKSASISVQLRGRRAAAATYMACKGAQPGLVATTRLVDRTCVVAFLVAFNALELRLLVTTGRRTRSRSSPACRDDGSGPRNRSSAEVQQRVG